jgi:ankyrin repeat protein
MSQHFNNLIRRGESAEIAAWIKDAPHMARWRDAQGVSALMLSIYTQQPAITELLREHCGELDIFEAAAVGDCGRMERLIADEATQARAVSGDGWPPLHLAAAFATPEAVALLLEHGAHVHQRSHNPLRNQALHACAALGNSVEAARLLLDAGAAVNETQAGGFTPLHQAAAAGKRELVKLLLERGADPSALCDQGKSAGDYARERQHFELAEGLAGRVGSA